MGHDDDDDDDDDDDGDCDCDGDGEDQDEDEDEDEDEDDNDDVGGGGGGGGGGWWWYSSCKSVKVNRDTEWYPEFSFTDGNNPDHQGKLAPGMLATSGSVDGMLLGGCIVLGWPFFCWPWGVMRGVTKYIYIYSTNFWHNVDTQKIIKHQNGT